jgi:hypothetical protein
VSVLASLAALASCSAPKEPGIDCSSKLTVATSMLKILKHLDTHETPYDEGAVLTAVALLNQHTEHGNFTLEQIAPYCGQDLKGLEAIGKRYREKGTVNEEADTAPDED